MDTPSKQRLDEILAKPADALGEDEVGFLRARRSYLSATDVKKFAEVLGVVEEKEADEDVVDYAKMTKAQVVKVCEEREIEIPAGSLKADIVELLEKE